ncbi:heavy metal-associated isoprenylated plant protein 39 isoform X2 [Cryptomeria japonica]|uniref:heavy metal-associated isoprenylated plant protein 39 isoform X2 n=2 Tax=Cryptomeria japonica TaxID=3369 RepID=UPI0027DA92D1|nr:heavy metal-associated isoprenylated plant protein 39 isoform X2 [Cryptomeria japonica]
MYAHSYIRPTLNSLHSATDLHTYQSKHLVILYRPVRMKKIVLKLALEDESRKRKALKMVAGVQGVDSVAVDMKDKKMTVIGDVDPVYLTSKLRKFSSAELVSVGPAKEEKKEGEKKEEKKPESDAKKNKAEAPKYEVVYVPPSYDSRAVSEENPNACVIC